MTIKALYPTARPILNLDFARAKVLDPRITFTRASTATFVGANGLIQTAASGVARFDHNPATGESLGLLVEEARTNLLNGSQTFATTGGTQNNWTDTDITRDGTLRTSPDGTANALRVTAAAANATIISSAAIGTSASRTFSVFLRRVTGTGDIQYTLNNGSTWTTQSITSSWVRYSFSATTADQQVGIKIVTSGDAIELWGIQLEAGAFPTSYIPTTTATVTRAVDVASITGTNFSSWYNQGQGTWLASGGSYVAGQTNTFFAEKTSNLGLQIFTNQAVWGVTQGSTTISQTTSAPIVALPKAAFAYTENGTAIVAANGTLGTAAAVGAFTGTTDLLINRSPRGVAGDNWKGAIARIAYYPVRLPDAQLQALTAT